MKWIRGAACMGGLLLGLQAPVAAQQRRVEVVPGPQYEADGMKRSLLGANWRHLWTTPINVPVLDLATFAGGLTPEEQGGGNQSLTLHMLDAQGRGWVFRSVDKFSGKALPPTLKGTIIGDIVQDQISALHPAGSVVVPTLLEAAGILHVVPQYFVMPDDPRLGEFRETFAGMLGGLEAKPEEGPDDTPGFAGSTKVKGSENFLEDLEDTPGYRLETREFLRARLIDLLVGDTDRGTDQWRWARFGTEGNQVYRPVPRDRDWVFANARGPIAGLARGMYPKLVQFNDEYSSLGSYTFSSHVLDRRLLSGLTRADFAEAANSVQAALTDQVIANAVGQMPREFQPLAADDLRRRLIARRDRLDDVAMTFYGWLVGEVNVYGTDEKDVAAIEHLADGSLRVRLSSSKAPGGTDAQPAVYFERVFLPSETNEVRVFMQGGDDRASVTGADAGILVRVIGGGGDDVLEDRAGRARFYDDRGDNEFVRADGTRVDTKPWDPPVPPEGFRAGGDWAPDWGGSRSLFSPSVDYSEAGVIVGGGPSWKVYGFRRLPYKWTAGAQFLYAIGSGGFAVKADADYRFMNSRRALMLEAEATQFDVFRFYGFGNDTPQLETSETRVLQDRVLVNPSFAWHIGRRAGGSYPAADSAAEEQSADPTYRFTGPPEGLNGIFAVGPLVQWTRMRPRAGTPLAAVGDEGFGQAGARAMLELQHTDRDGAPRRGFALEAEARAFPAVWDAASAFGSATAQVAGYLPLIGPSHLALRVGGRQNFGDGAPVFESAFIGGRHTLRGYRSDRFAGDAATWGGAELRVPLGTVQLIVNGELGVFGLADAGRVFVDGASPGGWHTGFGGGLWFEALDRAISVAYAHGETGRIYLWSGLPF